MSKLSLSQQWQRLIKTMSKRSLYADDRMFTIELYECLSIRCNMIAHHNREGFIKSRFWTLVDFDQTITSMRSSKVGKQLLAETDTDLLSQARYRIASSEANRLRQQAKCIEHHVEQLQSKFRLAL